MPTLFNKIVFLLFVLTLAFSGVFAQPPETQNNKKVRTVSIPVSIFTKQELQTGQMEEFLQADRLMVKEDGDEKTILSIRSVSEAPLSVAFVIQDDLASGFNLHLNDIKKFIRRLPRGSRVMVAYLRGGSLQVRQKFTEDLEKAASSLRIVGASAGAITPFDGVNDVLKRFDALPAGRRAIVLFSDGLDTSGGINDVLLSQSVALDNVIKQAQRKSVTVFSVYSPSETLENRNSRLILGAQGMLAQLSDETGGRSFFSGTVAPVSMDPFFKELSLLLNRQFYLTYVTDNMKKKYYKVEVTSSNPIVKIEHPKGYFYR